jgi:hypothetical protein
MLPSIPFKGAILLIRRPALYRITCYGSFRAKDWALKNQFSDTHLARLTSFALDCGSGWVGRPWLSEGDPPESVVTPMTGFDGAWRPHPGRHTTTPADFR